MPSFADFASLAMQLAHHGGAMQQLSGYGANVYPTGKPKRDRAKIKAQRRANVRRRK